MLSRALAVLLCPLSLFRMPARTWAVFLVYLVLCAIELGVVGALIVAFQEDARAGVIRFLFPTSWETAVGMLVDRTLASQQRAVLINAVVAGGLMIVTTTLFPIKEALSASFETRARLTDRPTCEHPLWEQAWEEIQLFVLFLAVQGSIFWIGYHPGTGRDIAALVLSYLFLFFSFAIDFISPIFQRHQGYYSQILKLLARRPFTSLGFGALMTSPVLIASWLWAHHPEWELEVAIGVLFGANVVSIAWAAVAGTWLGARLLPELEATETAGIGARVIGIVLTIAVLFYNGYAFGTVGRSLYHKSQILKCHYRVDLDSFELAKPSLIGSVISRKIDVGVSFDVDIENPTAIDVAIEDNRIVADHGGDEVATGRLSPVAIPAGKTIRHHASLRASISPLEIAKGRALLSGDGWQVILYLEIAEGYEFPVYLVTPPP